MALSLITDRTPADVAYYKNQYAKIVKDWNSLSSAEQTEWLAANLKGGYWYTDLGRVGSAIQYIAGLLNTYGYAITVSARTSWSAAENPTASAIQTYLTDVTAIKNKFYGTTQLPATMNGLSHTDANNIELLLLEIERNINLMIQGFRTSGSFSCGQGVILP